MTTFYSEQAANRRNSMLLAGLVVVVLFAFGALVGAVSSADGGGALLGGAFATTFGLICVAGSYWGGDQLLLSSANAHEVTAEAAPKLYDVVHELSIAAGLPMPKVYIIEDPSPNAFATGRDPAHASVAVTTGLLNKMDREELQGVLGHEMSHVRNYDIRFTLMVGALLGSVALLAQILFRVGLSSGRGSRKGGGGMAVIMIIGLIMMIVAPIFSLLVNMAVSRQREYLADASSVELTRNPAGLERALATLASDPASLKHNSGAVAHLYIVNPIKKFGGGVSLFSTHPPIVSRINRLRALSGQAPLEPSAAASLGGES